MRGCPRLGTHNDEGKSVDRRGKNFSVSQETQPNIVTKEALCNHSTSEPGGHKKKAFETPRPIPQATMRQTITVF